MKKALNFESAKEGGEEPRKIANAGDVKKFIERALKLQGEIDDLNEDLKELYTQADEQGIPKKELKIVVRHKRKPMPIETRQGVNDSMEKAGEQAYFAFV